MSAEYKEHLRQKMEKALDEARASGNQQLRDRIRAFENDLKKRITKENEELQKEKEKKLEEIRKKTKETKKKIEAAESKENGQLEKRIQELEKSTEEQKEKIRKEYRDIIEKNLAELKAEELEIQKIEKLEDKLRSALASLQLLIDANGDSFKIHREFEETKVLELEKSKENARKLAEEQAVEEEKRRNEIRSMAQKQAEQKVQNEIVVARKKEENAEKQLALSSEMAQVDVRSQLDTFHALAIRMDQLIVRDLNGEVEGLGYIRDSVKQHFGQCRRYFKDGLQAAHIQRAAECFEDLEFDVGEMSQHLTKMQRNLADLPKSEEKTQIVKEVKTVLAKIVPLNICISEFLGTYMIRSNIRNLDNEKNLEKLIEELDGLITSFGRFDSKVQEMNDHMNQRVDHLKRETGKKMITGGEDQL